ncbi:pyridoxal phosphate-dependent aminotransferase [Phaeovulum sp.]|uniref:pyridoxal phosphate-dependent aminotransferase n=1 Tax=Phaeovulum sp. TaxID=2934796 RepID=UPI003563F05C
MPNLALRPARRMASVGLSEIVRVSEAATALKASGRDVISLGTGEPDFPTPPHVIEAAHAAALAGETKYTATQGTLALRRAIGTACQRDNGYSAEPSEIIVSTGAKQVIFNAFFATLDEGDEVLIPAPYWTSYSDMVTVCGGVAKIIPTSGADGFRLQPAALAAAISPRTRWLLLNSPGNPSGAVLSADDQAALAEVLRAHPQVAVMSDEIYQHICYVPFASFRTAAPDLADRTLIVNGVSKFASMTGWRLGWGIGPAPLIKTMAEVQGQVTSGTSSISQAAAIAALLGPQDYIAPRRDAFRARRDLVAAALNATGRLRCPLPDGAFYLYADCSPCFGMTTQAGTTLVDDAGFCAELLAQEGVAVVPGRAFGLPGYFRLSYAYDEASLTRASAAIARFCASLT